MVENEQMREFLARALPWTQEGEAPFFAGIHWLSHPPDYEKPFWTGRAVRSVDEAVRAIKWAQGLPDVRDIYTAMGAQRIAKSKTSKAGHSYYLPVRAQDNVVSLKSLFLDIDCKDGPNGYASQQEAAAALGKFLKESGMPRPTMIVGSGGGFHCHWIVSRALTPHEWKPLALALAEATKKHGLKCDTQCTIDSARVLRPPETFNRKQSTPRPVRLIGSRLEFDYAPERLKEILTPYMTPEKAPPPLPPRAPLTGPNELAAGIEMNKAPPDPLAKLAEACPFVDDAVTTGGKDYSNPLWNLTTLIAVFTAEGRDAAHQMANQHPGYTQESTDQLFDRKEREKEQKGLGWPHCATISGTGAAQCATCPHKAKGKTPFHAIAPAAPKLLAKPADWDLPVGYVRTADNKVYKTIIQQDGSTTLDLVMEYPLYEPFLQSDPWALHFRSSTHAGHTKMIAMPFEDALAAGGIRTVLAKQGVALRGAKVKYVEEFIVSWIEKLQKHKEAVIQSSPFGWHVKDGKVLGFTYGGSLWSTDPPKPAVAPDTVTGSIYSPTGGADPWFEAAKMITTQGRPELEAIIASAFAAPLVRFANQPGVLMSAFSTGSGVGKTTALKVAASVWGDPVRGRQELDDTGNSVLNRIGETRALPLYWDELKSEEDTRRFVNIMFRLTGGREKSRMTSAMTQRSIGTWQTILVSASNESLIDYVMSRSAQSPAGLMRTFEYEVTAGTKGQIAVAEADRIIGKLNDNYGHVGLQYAKWLGANIKQIETDMLDMRKQVETELKATNDERFWATTVAVILQGARYANALGFTQFDEKALHDFMLGVVQRMRKTLHTSPNDMTKSDNVENVLSQFLNAMATRHTLWTNMVPLGRGRPSADIKIVRDATKLDGIYVHIGMENQILRISSTYFGSWLKEAGYSRHVFMRALEEKYGAKLVNGRIGGGTEKAVLATEYLIEVQLAGTPLVKVLEGEA